MCAGEAEVKQYHTQHRRKIIFREKVLSTSKTKLNQDSKADSLNGTEQLLGLPTKAKKHWTSLCL